MHYNDYCPNCGLLYNGGAKKVLSCGTRSHDVSDFEYIWDSSSSFGGVGHPHSIPPLIVKFPGPGSKVHGLNFVIDLSKMRPNQSEYIDELYDYLTRNAITEHVQIVGTQGDFENIGITPPGKPQESHKSSRMEELLLLKKLGISITFIEINEEKGHPSVEL